MWHQVPSYFDALTHCYISSSKSKFIKWLISLNYFSMTTISPATIHSWRMAVDRYFQSHTSTLFTQIGSLWKGSSKEKICQAHCFTPSNKYLYLDQQSRIDKSSINLDEVLKSSTWIFPFASCPSSVKMILFSYLRRLLWRYIQRLNILRY